MPFGLTHRELIQYTQAEQPDVLQLGVIDTVIEVLMDHYEKCEEERILNLAEVERKRMKNLEAETELKHMNLCIKRPAKSHCVKPQTKIRKPSVHWMNTLKPGVNPAPRSDKKQDGEYLAEQRGNIQNHPLKTESDQNSISNKSDHSQKQLKSDEDANLHLPFGMVRYPTPRTRKFLEAQTNELLYGLANQIVFLSSEHGEHK
uniref:Rho-GAP domain-containing protein n=1 Tax=Trichobilharzia regenti TaxID=157069 RepID=A0AA85IQI8_TRIRE|nr:unnamed protein product [Trichobilharzia regenti]